MNAMNLRTEKYKQKHKMATGILGKTRAWNEAERDWKLWTMYKYTGEDWTGEKFGKLHKIT